MRPPGSRPARTAVRTRALRSVVTVVPLAVVLLGLALALGGCAKDASGKTPDTDFNDADVAFATDVVQHHAQTLSMVDLTQDRRLSPEARTLAEEIRAGQTPEIEQLTDLLQQWDEPVPAAMNDDEDLPGGMSAEQMKELETAHEAEFQRLWLQMMVEHHEGAVELAGRETETGRNAEVIAIAEDILTRQRGEIERMRELLGG